MKKKKLERQLRERDQKRENERKAYLESLPSVVMNQSGYYPGEFWWKCPNHEGSFTYSKEINFRWGHPEELAFCAVCRRYYRFTFKEGESA